MQENELKANPILSPEPRQHGTDDYTEAEVRLGNRNSGIHLEMLRHDVTPIGMHYLLSHFDVPYVNDESSWSLQLSGQIGKPQTLRLSDLRQLPFQERTVTLECAGNGRTLMRPRWRSMPWTCEAVGTARWGGTPLSALLDHVELPDGVETVVFCGADKGVDGGNLHAFERALSLQQIAASDVMLAWQINGQPLPPQHGFPLRLIVPGWYGMASVKWLREIRFTDKPFQGYQQVNTYRYRESDQDEGTAVTDMRVKSLMVPPGLPDWYSRNRLLAAGPVELQGRAWSGNGRAIRQVEVSVQKINSAEPDAADNKVAHAAAAANDNIPELDWQTAVLVPSAEPYAWSGWSRQWLAEPGHYRLRCRATDDRGDVQPLVSRWDRGGFGNNVVQSVDVWVEKELPQAT